MRSLLLAVTLGALATFDTAADLARIRDEALHRSQVMSFAEQLTDSIGPRLTNSPGFRRAEAWAVDRLKALGASNAHIEPWGPFGRGWSLEGFTATQITPAFAPLVAYPKAWSPSTAGVVTGEPVLVDLRTDADFERFRGKLRGRIVLASPERPVPAPGDSTRKSDADLATLAAAPAPTSTDGAFHPTAAQRASQAFINQKWQFFAAEGAGIVLEPGPGANGTTYVQAAGIGVPGDPFAADRPRPWDPGAAVVPQVVVGLEHYNRIVRLLARGVPVTLAISITAAFDSNLTSGNVIAELPGTDLKDEVVMFGGCLDSWHSAAGATDNAAGAAVAMEVIRILRAVDLHPRRTIRIGLWAAEEQGTLGSQAYVRAHFGPRGPEFDRFSAYFNLDWGAGTLRGLYLQGNAAARPLLQSWLAPLADLGAATTTLAGMGSTDHMSFDAVGVPGFQFIRDFMEGSGTAAHTNMDFYERLNADDLKQAAAVVASIVYEAATSDLRVPRRVG